MTYWLRKLAQSRGIRSIGFHHLIMAVIASAVAMTAVLLAGAGATSIAQRIYLIEVSYVDPKAQPDGPKGPTEAWENITQPVFNVVKDSQLVTRLGYFGLCASQKEGPWICAGSAARLVYSGRFVDPLGLFHMAEKVKDDVIFPGFLIGSAGLGVLVFWLFATFPGWHEEKDTATGSEVLVKPFPSRTVMVACVAFTGLGSLFSFTAALWQHTASATAATLLETSTAGMARAGVGASGVALAWLIFGLWLVAAIASLVMHLSIAILDRLVEDD
ncbi:uncharacterized protein EI97DRAFT_491324 [Westerdykella ornata]|uniref:Membrane fusion mating protein FIG1 n=1 Tax=Westerdykella ornata TaxID=318751 RepID=A0A6A6K1Y8_WESOR|nr:uncharacterized protein EI97DRAFT_491324 [Westerdykella ornata]KAF2281399.1 hypothetical protein EI97DRAFT_491324 [Westerdykella ornata]